MDWVFNNDIFVGYVLGGFTAWCFAKEHYKTLFVVSTLYTLAALVDITRPLQ